MCDGCEILQEGKGALVFVFLFEIFEVIFFLMSEILKNIFILIGKIIEYTVFMYLNLLSLNVSFI